MDWGREIKVRVDGSLVQGVEEELERRAYTRDRHAQ